MQRPLAAVALVLALAATAHAAAPVHFEDLRKVTPEQLSIRTHREELANGMVVLLAPDPSVSGVLVWTSFRAGTLYEPPGRSGLAHLVEHVMVSGPTPDTDYSALLERRRARYFNASTGFDQMAFEVELPAEELPVALWVAADRLGTLPQLVDPALVEKHRRVVLQERAYRFVDEPYGLVDELVFSHLFARPHPLHRGVIGDPAELAGIRVEDVRTFVTERLVPANGVLTVVGNFDPAVARPLIAETLGKLPGGRRSDPPVVRPLTNASSAFRDERLGRRPRVTMAWRFSGMPHDHASALELGAQLLSIYVDGAWGMRVQADFYEFVGECAFRMDVDLPYDEPAPIVQRDAEGFLRMLTRVEMPSDLVLAANLALDGAAVWALDTLEGRAAILSRLELLFGSTEAAGEHLSRHWQIERDVVRDVARVYLKRPRVIVHARPTRPKPARAERE